VKGIFAAIAVAAPLTAIAILLLMQGRDEVRTQQDMSRTDMAIERAAFDRQFSKAWGEEPDAEAEQRLAQLKERRQDLEAKAKEQAALAESDTSQLRQAIEDSQEGLPHE
jgi:hypothetical protein